MPSNQALQSVLGGDRGFGPRLHEGPSADRVLDGVGARGAALGQSILISTRVGGAERGRILAHERRHVAQVAGRDADPARPIRLGPRGDAWEREADSGAGPPAHGADPQVLRRNETQNQGYTDSYGTCEPTADPGRDEEAEAGTCSLDESDVLESRVEPLTSTPSEGSLSSVTESAPVCKSSFFDASFDPDAIDVGTMRNDELNRESIRVDTWLTANGLVSPPHRDLSAYRRLQARLRGERARRVQTGHLWMTTAVDPVPEELFMLQASNGAAIIIRVDQSFASGEPNESFPGPIMTRQQFEDHLASLGIPQLTEEEYIERLRQTAAEIAPELLVPVEGFEGNLADPKDRFRGYTGQQGRLDVRVQGLQEALPWNTLSQRQGEYGEIFALHDLRGRGARAFYNAGPFWNTTGNPPWRGHEGRGLRLSAEGVDPLRPLRRGWDTSPAVDISLRQPLSHGRDAPSFDLMSVKVSYARKANRNQRYEVYLRELGKLGDTSPSRRNLTMFRDANAPGVSREDTAARMALMIPGEHAADLRDLLRNPTGYETTEGGNRAQTPNWAMEPRSGRRTPDRWQMHPAFANARFPTPIDLGDGQPALGTGRDLFAALRAGRIDQAQFDQHVTTLGERLAQRVFGFDMPESTVRYYEDLRRTFRTTNARDLLAGTPIEVLDVEESHRRRGGAPNLPSFETRRGAALSVAHRTGSRGAGTNVTLSALTNLTFNENANLSDPRYQRQLLQQLAVEGAANYVGDAGESLLRTRIGYQALGEGLEATSTRMLTRRLAARALPGVADVVIEAYQMGTDDRENSVEEVIVRTGRAAVIGGTSAWAGAAAGTAVGGPVGFVVGFGVGLAVGWVMNEVIAGSGEDYAQAEAERLSTQRRAEADASRQAELARRIAAAQRRIDRLNQLLSSGEASSVGVEGIFGMPTDNPMFMRSEAGVEPTIGQLEREYILSSLRNAQPASPATPEVEEGG